MEVAPWSVLPFAGLLLCIAVLPLAAKQFWHSNRNQALVSGLFALPVVTYLLYLDHNTGHGLHELLETLHEYVAFILFLGALYVVAGGIVVDLNVRPGTQVNLTILAVGGALANLIGTTGASMVLIRPYLRLNQNRRHRGHLPIFFIFIVSNLGGLLTPLGDPPLFIGFLRGVDFFWTLRLWREWLVVNGLVLLVFAVWDLTAWRREAAFEWAPMERSQDVQRNNADERVVRPMFGLRGSINLLLLAGIIATTMLKPALKGSHFELAAEAIMLALGLLSLVLTPRGLRQANGFGWGPIIEVAIIFVGIFITMIPALELLKQHGDRFGLTEPWQFFWLTGLLSAFLDNAPTYLTFATLAAGSHQDLGWLMVERPRILAAISCGAVFMGACTYIGNGPNFMVKAITEDAGYRTATFFGYLFYSAVILVPVFVLVTFIFFRTPG
jgi:Na+/H+ antiporter NhaD/arsenite permease-like protein